MIFNPSVDSLSEVAEKKWGKDQIIDNLIRIKSMVSSGHIEKIVSCLCEELEIQIPDNNRDRNILKSNVFTLLESYKIPLRPAQFEEFVADYKEKLKKKENVTWQDFYGDFYMPECTGYVLDLINHGYNVLLLGQKGCGKTELSKVIFKNILEIPYSTVDISQSITRVDLEGSYGLITKKYCRECGSENFTSIVKDNNKNTICLNCHSENSIVLNEEKVWEDGLLGKACRENSGVVFNEIDACSDDLSTSLMELLQDHTYTIMQTGERISCSNLKVLATCNTIEGSNDMYNRQLLDKAFLSRMVVIRVDYLTEDKEIRVLKRVNHSVNDNFAQRLVNFANWTRKSYAEGHLSDVISTRELVYCVKMFERNNRWDESSCVKIFLCNKFNKDEITLVTEAASKEFMIKNLSKINM